MPKPILLIAFFLCLLTFVGCNPVEQATTDSSSTDGSGSPAAPTEETSPLYVVLQSRYESITSNTFTREGECSVASTAATPATKNITCSITIPELRLHYSDLKFTVGTSSSTLCPFLSFSPYYYLRSNSNITLQGNYEAKDCSGGKYLSDSVCWGGAAENILSKVGFTFPGVTSVYFSPSSEGLSQVYELDSANTLRAQNAALVTAKTASVNADFSTNAFATNSLASGSRAASIAANNVNYAGSGIYQDYEFACRDIYGEQTYSITLTISDYDTETAEGVSNNFYDWN